MSKYKINIDKPLPDPKVIEKYKNFDSLYDHYQVNTRFEFWRNIYRNPTYFAGLVAVIAVLFLVFEATDEESKMPFVFPPSLDAQPEFASFTFDADSGLIYTIESGTRVHLPAQAWVDQQQKAIGGKVELKVRELKDPADMFLAGINSRYDSAENQHLLSSEGLVEIQVFANGEPVFLGKDQQIMIEYFSYDTASQLGVYFLDTTQRNWAFKGNDEVELLAVASNIPTRPEMPAILRQTDELTAKSMGILLPKPGRPFGVKVKNPNDYPEFQGFEKVYWEYVVADKSSNPWTEGLIGNNTTWGDVRVKRLPRRGYYQLSFSRIQKGKMEVKTVVATPLFKAKNLAEAENLYQQKYQEWEKTVAARKQENAEQAELERKKQAAQAKYLADVAEWEQVMASLDSVAQMPAKCYRKFAVKQTGVFNFASTVPMPPAKAKVKLINDQGEALDHTSLRVFGVDEKVNALIPSEKDEDGNFAINFDPTSQKVIWAAGPESQLYRLLPTDLVNLNNDSENVQEFIPRPIKEDNFLGIKDQLMGIYSEREPVYN